MSSIAAVFAEEGHMRRDALAWVLAAVVLGNTPPLLAQSPTFSLAPGSPSLPAGATSADILAPGGPPGAPGQPVIAIPRLLLGLAATDVVSGISFGVAATRAARPDGEQRDGDGDEAEREAAPHADDAPAEPEAEPAPDRQAERPVADEVREHRRACIARAA